MCGKIYMLLCSFILVTWVQASPFEKDSFKTKEGYELSIHFIKHGTLMLTYRDAVIQIDPVSSYADYSKLPKADVLLITHEHGDHLDKKAIDQTVKEGTVLITNESSVKILNKGSVMKNGDKLIPTDYLTLEAVPAYNTTAGREMYHPKHRDNGYILTLGGTRIYVAGDTEDIPEMAALGDIDIAFIPVNQPYTMTIDQAVNAARMIKPAILYPYHYGETDVTQLKKRLVSDKAIDVRIRQLQ